MISVEHLSDDLDEVGVATGDLVMVHASLKAIGPVEGGAGGVIRALDLAVGPAGTLMMTLGAHDEFAWVNEHPEPERERLLEDAPVFEPRHSPADPDVGVLAEIFRQQPGTVVSDHPEGRFGARGARATDLMADQPWDDYYGPGSPLEKLVDGGGKVLRLGADADTVTLMHYAEFLADLPDKRRVARHRKVLGPHGPVVRIIETLDDSEGIVDYPGGDYFADICLDYIEADRASTGTVGNARTELFDAGDLIEFAVEWMEENLT